MAVLGDVREAGVAALAHVERVTSRPPSAIVPRRDAAQPGDRLDELGLAVALDAGDAEDLAGRDR